MEPDERRKEMLCSRNKLARGRCGAAPWRPVSLGIYAHCCRDSHVPSPVLGCGESTGSGFCFSPQHVKTQVWVSVLHSHLEAVGLGSGLGATPSPWLVSTLYLPETWGGGAGGRALSLHQGGDVGARVWALQSQWGPADSRRGPGRVGGPTARLPTLDCVSLGSVSVSL